MKKTIFTFALSLLATAGYAQWTKPALPTAQKLQLDIDCYLFNRGAEGFLVGDNDWGTRASVHPTHGHKIRIQKFEDANVAWDGESYFINNDIEQGNMAGKQGNLFTDDPSGNIWVDREVSTAASSNQGFTFTAQGDAYRIGWAKVNEAFSYEVNCQGAYLGIIPEKQDTRLYICYPESSVYDVSGYKIDWIFVSEADYASYTTAVLTYDEAVALGKEIAQALAENEGIDISSVEAVYNNSAATQAQLSAARTQLTSLVVAWQTARATAETPANYSSYIQNATYDSGNNNGWSGTGATVNYGEAEIYSWGANQFDYYQQLSALPQGIYRVGVTGYYRSGTNDADAAHFQEDAAAYQHTSLYATTAQGTTTALLPLQSAGATSDKLHNEVVDAGLGNVPNSMAAAAVYFAQGLYAPATTLAQVEDGALRLGLQKSKSETDNWAIFDNWTLHYLGQGIDAYQLMAEQVLADLRDLAAEIEDGSIEYYPHALGAEYAQLRQVAKSSTEVEALKAALAQLPGKHTELLDGIAAYNDFEAQVQEAQDWLAATTSTSEATQNLAAYIDEAFDILLDGNLSTTEVKAEGDKLQQLFYDARANSMSDGDDCTTMLLNPNFTQSGGWQSAVGPVWPNEGLGVGSADNMIFDVYQELTGLQNGLYEFSTYDIYRAANSGDVTGSEDFKAYIYVNSFKKRMNGLLSDGSAERIHEQDELVQGLYVPSSAQSANAHFEQGKYAQRVYGLVTDGTLRLGYLNELRYADGSRAWWGPAKLIFRGRNADALREAISLTNQEAEQLLYLSCGQEEISALEAAMSKATTGSDDELYDALIALKEAMQNVSDCADLYTQIVALMRQLEEVLGDASLSEDLYNQAKAAYDEANASLEASSLNAAQAQTMVEEMTALYVSIKMDGGKASLSNPKDVSSFIVNNDFDPSKGDKNEGRIDGWVTSALNGYKENSASYNRAKIDLYQDLIGLPEGTYKATVHTYYRAGYWNEEEQHIAAGEDTHLTKLYATTTEGTEQVDVMNLTEGATDEIPAGITKVYTLSDGRYAPDGTSPSVAYFKAGYYLNEVVFYVGEDGKARIGLKKDEIISNDYEVVGQWNLIYYGEGNNVERVRNGETDEPSVTNPKDVSALIVNNDFDPSKGDKNEGRIDGWVTSALNGYKQNTASYNRAEIKLYQDLSALPEGTYRVTVHTYYRAGYYNEEEERIQNGQETHLTKLYATTSEGTEQVDVMNLTEGSSEEIIDGAKVYTLSDGTYAPDGTTPSVAYFNAGYYLNELFFYVGDDGKARIGLEKKEILSNDYEVVGQWNLYYYGKGNNVELLTPVNDVPAASATGNEAIYSLQGMRQGKLQRGLNIVRRADGSVVKVMVK